MSQQHQKETLFPIDLLRFFAASLVVAVHKLSSLITLGYLPLFIQPFTAFTKYGYLGVNLFFLISGFVITLSSEGRTVREFISARFIRLYPVFWISTCITSGVLLLSQTPSSPGIGQFFANMTMIPTLISQYHFIESACWTLVYELKFYITISIVLALQKKTSITPEKLAVFSSPFILLNALKHSFLSSFAKPLELFVDILGGVYAQHFMAGILFYALYKKKRVRFQYLALLLLYLAALLRTMARSDYNPLIDGILITSFFVIFLLIAHKKITNSSLGIFGTHYKHIVVTLGAITYPLYLLHNTLISFLVDVFAKIHLPTLIASPLLFGAVAYVVLTVNKIDVRVRKWWKEKGF